MNKKEGGEFIKSNQLRPDLAFYSPEYLLNEKIPETQK